MCFDLTSLPPRAKIHTLCGESLAATEKQYRGVVSEAHGDDWHLNYEYHYAAVEIADRYRPDLFASLTSQSHFTLDAAAGGVAEMHLWTNAAREMDVPQEDESGVTEKVRVAEVQYYSYLKLTAPLENGGSSHSVADRWGNEVTFAFDDQTTVSWALKVDQMGYASSAPKFGFALLLLCVCVLARVCLLWLVTACGCECPPLLFCDLTKHLSI
jgi:hypothetical protein